MKKILSLKSWQIFLVVVIPTIYEGSWYQITLSFSLIAFNSWIYAIGKLGHEALIDMGLATGTSKFFKPQVILMTAAVILGLIMGSTIDQNGVKSSVLITTINVALGVFVVFAAFYEIRYVSKTLAMLEFKSPVIYTDYMSYMFLFAMFPVGVWRIQPKVKRLIYTSSL